MVPYSCEYFNVLLSSKGEGMPGHAIKACGGSEGLAPFILKLGARCQRLVSVMPHLLPGPLLPDMRLAGPQNQSGCLEKQNMSCLYQEVTTVLWTYSP